jgi:uncharacterized protein (TIGR03086 family)
VTLPYTHCPTAAYGLLERAIGYALGTLQSVTPDVMSAPTPCARWDLQTLLAHVNESLDLLSRCVGASDGVDIADPVRAFRAHAGNLVGALAHRRPEHTVAIAGGYRLGAGVVAATGAVEIAVHGWDVSRATHTDRPIPRELAGDLWGVGRLVAADIRHHRLFAPAITPPAAVSLGDQLVALLGRDPVANPARDIAPS